MSGMSTKFIYALILTVIGAITSLLLYFTGYQTEKLATGEKIQLINLVIMFIVLWLGIRAVREESEPAVMSYGKGVGTGVLISLYSGLMSAVYSFIHLKFVNPNFADYKIELLRSQWAQKGMNDAQLEQAEHVARMMMGPVFSALITPIIVVLFGVLMSLIISAFLKRKAPEASQVTA